MHTSMHQAGKRASQQLRAMSFAGPTQSHLFYVTNHASGLKFLIDVGAEVSVVPHSHTHQKTQEGPSLQSINNTSIATYGTCSLTLNLGLRRTFRWVFMITDISKTILGADFFNHYDLSVDIKSHHLLDPLTQLKVQGIVSSVMSSLVLSLLLKQPKSDYQKILMDSQPLLIHTTGTSE